MKNLLIIPALVATVFGFSPSQSLPVPQKAVSKVQAAKFVSRGTILDNSGNYLVYVDSNPGYYGSFGGGGVVLTVQNVSTSAFYSTTSKLGSISSTGTGDYISGKCRFIEGGATQEIFFDGDLN
jgi:hypothetical protein